VPHRSGDGHVWQFDIRGGVPQQQPASAHIAAAHKVCRKQQTRAKDLEQRIDILRRRDAAEEHDLAVADFTPQRLRALLERSPIRAVLGIDILRRKLPDCRSGDPRIRTPQTGIRRDHVHTAADDRIVDLWRRGEPPGIRQLPAEIQLADKRKQLTEGDADRRVQPLSDYRPCFRRKQLRSAAAVASAAREAARWIFFMCLLPGQRLRDGAIDFAPAALTPR